MLPMMRSASAACGLRTGTDMADDGSRSAATADRFIVRRCQLGLAARVVRRMEQHTDLGRVGLWTFQLELQPMAKAQAAVAELESVGCGAIWCARPSGASRSRTWRCCCRAAAASPWLPASPTSALARRWPCRQGGDPAGLPMAEWRELATALPDW